MVFILMKCFFNRIFVCLPHAVASSLQSFQRESVLRLSDIPDPTRFGFGYIEFEFPKDTYAPNIPVRSSKKDGASPVFPLEGKTFACTPDVYAGLKQGARIKVLGNGFIMPQMADTPVRLLRLGTNHSVLITETNINDKYELIY